MDQLKKAKESLNSLRHDHRRKMQSKLLNKIKRNGGVNSKEFWKFVEKFCPNYKEKENWLKENKNLVSW